MAFGSAAVSVAVGVSLAENEIDNLVEASISNADAVKTTQDQAPITASEEATIDSVTQAASAAAAIGLGGSSASGVTNAKNTLTSEVKTFISKSQVNSAKDVLVSASAKSKSAAETD